MHRTPYIHHWKLRTFVIEEWASQVLTQELKGGEAGWEDSALQAHTGKQRTACERAAGRAVVTASLWVLQLTADRAAGLGAQGTFWSSQCKSWTAAEAAGHAPLRASWEKRGKNWSVVSVHCALCTVLGTVHMGGVCCWVLHGPLVSRPSTTSQVPLPPKSQGPHIISWWVPPAFPAKLSMELSWALSSSFSLPMPLPKVLLDI